jgi:uncharacterized membrane protein YfcA
MLILGYICATIVGISLGLLGSGGSILTVPIMVYIMKIPPVDATSYSLFVVGITSASGGISYIRKKLVDLHIAIIFAIPSIISVFITRKFIIPLIPDPVLSNSSIIIPKDLFIMILFSMLMIIVSYNMIRPIQYKEPDENELQKIKYASLITIGLASGLLTGLLGVGGGFIIIPALVFFAKIPVRMSVGTSLLIIAFNSFGGFLEESIINHNAINYIFLLQFSIASIAGIFIGFRLSLGLKPNQLRKIFGWFILVMGIAIFIKEVFGLY